MDKSELITKLSNLKASLLKDGFVIMGFFGSYAREDNSDNSDIDLLYNIDNPQEFAHKFGGFGAFVKLEEIKEYLSKELNKKIDLVAYNSLNSIGKKYILKDLVNV